MAGCLGLGVGAAGVRRDEPGAEDMPAGRIRVLVNDSIIVKASSRGIPLIPVVKA